MRTIIAALAAVLLAGTASAQCPGGRCAAPRVGPVVALRQAFRPPVEMFNRPAWVRQTTTVSVRPAPLVRVRLLVARLLCR